MQDLAEANLKQQIERKKKKEQERLAKKEADRKKNLALVCKKITERYEAKATAK